MCTPPLPTSTINFLASASASCYLYRVKFSKEGQRDVLGICTFMYEDVIKQPNCSVVPTITTHPFTGRASALHMHVHPSHTSPHPHSPHHPIHISSIHPILSFPQPLHAAPNPPPPTTTTTVASAFIFKIDQISSWGISIVCVNSSCVSRNCVCRICLSTTH